MSESEHLKPVREESPVRDPRRERAVEDGLRALVKEYVGEVFPELEASGMELPISLTLTYRPGEPGRLVFDPDLRAQVRRQAEAFLLPSDSFSPGAVYDFHEGTTESRDSRPPTARSVFEGYGPMGHPAWTSFDEWRDTGLGQGVLTVRQQTGKELRARQLEEHGRSSTLYGILGQACVGYLQLPPAYERIADDDRLAITVQVVEIRDGRYHFDLVLNVLAGRLTPDELDSLLMEPDCQNVLVALRKLEEDLLRIRDRAAKAWHHLDRAGFQQAMQRVPGLLTRFARSLTLDLDPPRKSEYPVLDVQVAGLGDLFFDHERESWVLLGNNQTAYVFDAQGGLLTSFQATEERVNLRLDCGRWRPADDQDLGVLELLKSRAESRLPSGTENRP